MKLFRLDLGIKDRYRRGLAQGARTTRSPQAESSETVQHDEYDPHHQAASPTSPSVLFSAGIPSTKAQPDDVEQWNEFGVSPLEVASSSSSAVSTTTTATSRSGGMNAHAQTHAVHPHYSRVGSRYLGRQYDQEEEYDDDGSSDGYMSSSSSSSGGSIASGTSSLSPYHSSDDDEHYDDEDNDGDDEESESDYYSHAEEDTAANTTSRDARSLGGDSSGFSYYNTSSSSSNNKQRQNHHQSLVDYYGGLRHKIGEHVGLLPPAPAPAIEPIADRDIIEQEARQRRWERHVDKRRQSLNGGQPLPAPRRKKRKKAKDLRKQVLLKNAQYVTD